MIENLKCVNENVNLDDYLKLYKYVRDNMEHPEWLGTFTRDEIIEILNVGGKIWLYYDNSNLVCSMFYIPSSKKSLVKHNVNYNEYFVGSLGPIMVSPDYVGHGYQIKMMNILDEYCRSINKKYIFTKVCSDNLYSLNNMLNDNYKVVDEYESERGMDTALIKEINKK